MSENHVDVDKTDVAYMKQLVADLEKRVEAVEKLREQRKLWVRPPAQDSTQEDGAASTQEGGAAVALPASEVTQENGATKENGVGKELTIQFEVKNATTTPGQNIYATGNLKELGSFTPSGAIKLSTTQSTYPTWNGEVTVHDYSGEPIQIKFFKMTDNNESGLQWDSHGEYTITPSEENSVKHSVVWTS